MIALNSRIEANSDPHINGDLEIHIFTLILKNGAPELYIFTLNLEMGAPEPYILTINFKKWAPDLYIFFAKHGNGGP